MNLFFAHLQLLLLPRCARLCKKKLAKIDTEMLIPEGRKLPLKVVAKGKNFDNFSRAVKNIQLNDKVDLIFVFALLDLIFELQCSNSI